MYELCKSPPTKISGIPPTSCLGFGLRKGNSLMVKYSLLMATRNYQRFKGNNRFYCGGRLMSARQAGILIFCMVAIIVMACLFFPFE